MSRLVEEQLKKVEKADLTHFNKDTNTYFIPKKKEIKLEEDKCYLVHLKDTLFVNDALRINWNAGSLPTKRYLKIDISKTMPKMIKVVAVGYDAATGQDIPYFWNGWLTVQDIEVLQVL